MRLLSFLPEPPIERGQEKTALGAAAESLLRLLCSYPFDHVLAGCLGRQPRDEPGAEEPDQNSNQWAGNGEPEWNRLP
jgi:hypothetical protein